MQAAVRAGIGRSEFWSMSLFELTTVFAAFIPPPPREVDPDSLFDMLAGIGTVTPTET